MGQINGPDHVQANMRDLDHILAPDSRLKGETPYNHLQ
jgi:hypothetical protein